jgi:hypothetical protein
MSGQKNLESRLFFEGTVTATDMDRATDTREKGRIGITGSAQAYGGSNGRVTSEAIGRDINPLGRGGGAALVGGMMNQGILAPRLPGGSGGINQGNSVNNTCIGCGGLGSPQSDPKDGPQGYYDDWIISNNGGNKMYRDCYFDWLNRHARTGEKCPPVQYTMNCACTVPGGEDWKNNPRWSIDAYCHCVVGRGCRANVGFAGNPGVSCQPPSHCIVCHNIWPPGDRPDKPEGNGCSDWCKSVKKVFDEAKFKCDFMFDLFSFLQGNPEILAFLFGGEGVPRFPFMSACGFCDGLAIPDAITCPGLCLAIENALDKLDGWKVPYLDLFARDLCLLCCSGLTQAGITFGVNNSECCEPCC